MFNRKKNERIRQLEQQVETLKDQNQRLWDRINDAATLISIERVGREIFFTYKRQGRCSTLAHMPRRQMMSQHGASKQV